MDVEERDCRSEDLSPPTGAAAAAAAVVEVAPAARVVALPDGEEVDADTVDAVFDPLDEAAGGGDAHLILDTRGLTFMDSSGLARLIRLSQICRLSERLLVLIPGDYLKRLLQMTGLSVWFTLADDESHARSLLPGGGGGGAAG